MSHSGYLQLLGLGNRFEAHSAAVPDAVAAGEPAHAFAHRVGLAAGQIGAAPVEPLVPGEQLGPVAVERGEEVLTRPGTQVEEVRPDSGCARCARLAHDVGEQLRPVAEAGKDNT